MTSRGSKQNLKGLGEKPSVTIVCSPFLPPGIDTYYEELQRPFTMAELVVGIREGKLDKAAGEDEITVEAIRKLGTGKGRVALLGLFNIALEKGEIPALWKDAVITILFKKGDSRATDNYWGIALLSHIGTLLERLIQNRLLPYLSDQGHAQNAQGSSCTGRGGI